MKEKQEYKTFLPEDLYKQIEELYDSFRNVQQEVSGLVSNTRMTNTAAHLEDVLQATEEATHTILDAATTIQLSVESGVEISQIQKDISAEVGKIYEACNFQDISSQRIKKVLKFLDTLDQNLSNLARTAKTYAAEEVKETKIEDSLLSGPQLSAEAPSQQEIDKLFSSLK